MARNFEKTKILSLHLESDQTHWRFRIPYRVRSSDKWVYKEAQSLISEAHALCILSNETHKLIIKRPLFSDGKEDSVQVDTHLDQPVECEASDFSAKQLQRVNTQSIYVANISRLFHKQIVETQTAAFKPLKAVTTGNVSHGERILRDCKLNMFMTVRVCSSELE